MMRWVRCWNCWTLAGEVVVVVVMVLPGPPMLSPFGRNTFLVPLQPARARAAVLLAELVGNNN